MLVLDYCEIELKPTVFDTCTGITHLELRKCFSADSSTAGPACLASLVGLHHLEIEGLHGLAFPKIPVLPADAIVPARFPCTILPALPQLTSLVLVDVVVEGLEHVSGVSLLHRLAIKPKLHPLLPQPVLCRLPASVCDLDLGASLTLDPSVALSPHTQLTALALRGVRIISNSVGTRPVVQALLSALPNLQELQELQLFDLECAWPSSTAAFTALVASSKLKSLTVHKCDWPPGVWECVFQHSMTLPSLRRVDAWQWSRASSGFSVAPGLMWSTSLFSRLVSCCPALKQL